MPAAENIVIRYNAFTAGYSFHKVKTAFKAFSFVLKIVFYGSFADAKPIFSVRRGRAGGGEQHSPVERVILFCRAVLF